tara:strand:+ start:110846 stop:111751 length:906 start_codon:yes stop_codon:yes gene_type:complete
MLTNAQKSKIFNSSYEKIHRRVKQYIDNKEGAWVFEASEFLKNTLPSLQQGQDIEYLIEKTIEFCQKRITSSFKQYLPLSKTFGVMSGFQGSPLANDLLLICEEIKTQKASGEIHTAFADLDMNSEQLFDSAGTKETNKDSIRIISPTPRSNLSQAVQTTTLTSELVPPLQSVHDSTSPINTVDETNNKSRSEDVFVEGKKSEEPLDLFDKIKLGIFGGEEGQEKFIKRLEVQLKKERAKTDRLWELNRVLHSTIKVQTEEIATFYHLQNQKIKTSTKDSRMATSEDDQTNSNLVSMPKLT